MHLHAYQRVPAVFSMLPLPDGAIRVPLGFSWSILTLQTSACDKLASFYKRAGNPLI
jgi:hypothetical protein